MRRGCARSCGNADEDSYPDGNEEPPGVALSSEAPRSYTKRRNLPSLPFVGFVGTPEALGEVGTGRQFFATHESPGVIRHT
jgi:hypothetical protein